MLLIFRCHLNSLDIMIVMHRYFIGISRVEFNTALYKDTWISLESNVFPFYTTVFIKYSLETKDSLPNMEKKQLFLTTIVVRMRLASVGSCTATVWEGLGDIVSLEVCHW